MEYTMEELFPILGQLAEKYTAFESTSIPYETAEQLTEAVLYCIREAEQVQTNALVQAEGLSARQAYAIGAAAVEEKTRAALALYTGPLWKPLSIRCLSTGATGIFQMV